MKNHKLYRTGIIYIALLQALRMELGRWDSPQTPNKLPRYVFNRTGAIRTGQKATQSISPPRRKVNGWAGLLRITSPSERISRPETIVYQTQTSSE
jgi:hypothetical protein